MKALLRLVRFALNLRALRPGLLSSTLSGPLSNRRPGKGVSILLDQASPRFRVENLAENLAKNLATNLGKKLAKFVANRWGLISPDKLRNGLGTVLITVSGAVAGTVPAEAETYRFGVVPQFEAMRLASIWMPILEALEARTGHRFQMAGSPNIPSFERSFVNGDFDFAYMNPYHAVVAMERQGYIPLVRDGGRELFGVLVVRNDSTAQSPEDLAGQTIAFPAPNALGASLLMRADLERRFDLDYTPIYAATHSSAYLNVVLGRAAAAGGVMSTLKNQADDVRDKVRVIYETTRVPTHPIVVHPRVSAEVREAVLQAFLELGQTEAGRAMLSEVPIQDIAPAHASEYDPLLELKLERFVE